MIDLQEGTACVVLGGSSITTLSPSGEINKNQFYPTSLEEYVKGIVEASLSHGRLQKSRPGVLLVSAPGAFQNEGAIAGLPPNFHRVKEDALQRGIPNLFFRELVESELNKRGYGEVLAYGYNDAAPALAAVLSQSNTEEVLSGFETELNVKRSDYAIKYIINGTGTGEASLYPDNSKILTAEKGHLKPNFLWYELNPFFKYITCLSVVGQNRSIERLLAGGPEQRTIRHFTKIFNAVVDSLKDPESPFLQGLSEVLGFQNYQELQEADGQNGLLSLSKQDSSLSLKDLGVCIEAGSAVALSIRNAFARALGSAAAYMHFVVGEMPDTPLNTFIGPLDIRHSALAFIRSDGSTTALFAQDKEAWNILERGAQDYAKANLRDEPHLFKVLNINEIFPNIHPDFGGLPELAADKLARIR